MRSEGPTSQAGGREEDEREQTSAEYNTSNKRKEDEDEDRMVKKEGSRNEEDKEVGGRKEVKDKVLAMMTMDREKPACRSSKKVQISERI